MIDDQRLRGGFPFHNGRREDTEIVHSKTRAGRILRIHVEDHSRSARRIFDAVFDIDDRFLTADIHLHEGVPHLRRPILEEIPVVGKQLHNDRLWRSSQISNHVLEQLNELDVEHRLRFSDPLANLADDIVNAALPLILQLDGEVNRVGFGHREDSQLQTCAARSAFDFGGLVNDLLDVIQNTIGFLKRTTRRHDVIENKSALIECGKESRSKLAIRQI